MRSILYTAGELSVCYPSENDGKAFVFCGPYRKLMINNPSTGMVEYWEIVDGKWILQHEKETRSFKILGAN